MIEFKGAARKLSTGDISDAAFEMGCDDSVVQAVCDVESSGSGFLSDGRPKILFEAHIFYRITKGKFGVSNISSRSWDRSLYGAGGAHQYSRLDRAIQLDRNAAIRSSSWGMFQILGDNYKLTGHNDPESFVVDMIESEANHLSAFMHFCDNAGLVKYLRRNPPDFTSFARGYNGPGYAQNDYDVKMAAAWRKYRDIKKPQPNPSPRTVPEKYNVTLQLGSSGAAVRELQATLGVKVDGDYGPRTMAAVVAFQENNPPLLVDGIAGPATLAKLYRDIGNA